MQSTEQTNIKNPSEMSLHDLVENDHRLSAIFERYGLNYCCKGARSLAEACAENDLDTDEVLAEIDRISADSFISSPSEDRNVRELLRLLYEAYGSKLQEMLPPARAKLQKVAASHGDAFPQVIAASEAMAQLADELLPHLDTGKEILTPRVNEIVRLVEQDATELAQVSNSALEHLVHRIHKENRLVQWYLSEMRDFTSHYRVPEGVCMTFSVCYRELAEFDQTLSRFLSIEEDLLIPRLIASPSGWVHHG